MDYKEINRRSWNQRVSAHMDSEFYDHQGFLAGRSSLNAIELGLLGDISGKKVLHLQCHFGQDTISLARMGAEAVGVDISDQAVDQARKIAESTGADARFICCDIYDLPNHLDEEFDIVFTSYGTIGWLPDMDRWAGVVSRFLKPGGKFLIVEFHPVVWMFDDSFSEVAYNYFNAEPIVETTSAGTYAEREAEMTLETVSWNHNLAEVMTALLGKGLRLSQFREYDYSPYDCFQGTIEFAPGKYRIERHGNRLPMVYALEAMKP